LPRKKENQVEEKSNGGVKENRINDSPSLTEMDLPHNREEFSQELNPLNHVPLALEMNKFDEITTCVKDRE